MLHIMIGFLSSVLAGFAVSYHHYGWATVLALFAICGFIFCAADFIVEELPKALNK